MRPLGCCCQPVSFGAYCKPNRRRLRQRYRSTPAVAASPLARRGLASGSNSDVAEHRQHCKRLSHCLPTPRIRDAEHETRNETPRPSAMRPATSAAQRSRFFRFETGLRFGVGPPGLFQRGNRWSSSTAVNSAWARSRGKCSPAGEGWPRQVRLDPARGFSDGFDPSHGSSGAGTPGPL